MSQPAEVPSRTSLRRHPERGAHDSATIRGILDEGLIAHVGFVAPHGPVVLPMAFARVGDDLILHGARANAMLANAASGEPVCVTVTVVDALVLARSAFRHSMNYRSVVVFARAREVTDETEKRTALEAIVNRLGPTRSTSARCPSDTELATTRVLALPLDEASAKARTGPPVDAEADLARETWAGELRIETRLRPVRAPNLRASLLATDISGIVEREEDGVVVSTDPSRLDLDAVHEYLSREAYWARGVSRETVERSIEGSIVAGAYVEGRTVGFARAVTDGATFAWLADVFVLEDLRRRGTATRLVMLLREHPSLSGLRRWMLGTADAHALYERLGFRLVPDGRFMQHLRA